MFYDGKLHIFEPTANLPEGVRPGVYWVDAKGSSYKHKAGSRYNTYEADSIIQLLHKILPTAKERGLKIGVTTPYTKQHSILVDKVAQAFEKDDLEYIHILTVHKFQGSEVDILIFSPVLATQGDGGSDYWYVRSKQILNVAISRAKHMLFIVGDQEFALGSESKLRDIAEYCLKVKDGKGTHKIPNRPMNVFEKQLLDILKDVVEDPFRIEPQYVVDGRFTIDFALLSPNRKIAIELDGGQHEIVGGLPVFEDKQRDAFLRKRDWSIVRIPVHQLRRQPQLVQKALRDTQLDTSTH